MQEAPDNFYVLLLIATAGVVLLALLPVLLVIVFRNKALLQERKLQQAALQHQKALLQAIVQSQEQERSHIGTELHDNIINSMMLLNLHIQKADKTSALELSENIASGIRSLSHGLSPVALRLFGLEEALMELAEKFQNNAGLGFDWRIEAMPPISTITYETGLHIYRIVQELITNTIKHAQASSVCIHVERADEKFSLFYSDDGIGFNPDDPLKRQHGIYNIESRLQMLKATYTFSSAPGKGMQMQAHMTIPIESENSST